MRKKKFFALCLAIALVAGSFVSEEPVKVQAANEVVIQTDVPDLKDVLTKECGDDFLVGAAICNNEISDANTMALVTKHNNAVTFGNELKPDCMFNYSNNVCPGTEEVTLNGEKLVVPVTNYDRAEMMLDYFYDWNEAHPEEAIKIRGHVLTWHSQTPEWFFHEDYDASKPYVSPEVMTKRHEWYIKTVLEHFVGEDSKYKDMFYGWDVVNEAVSDGTGTYRNDTENSSWWAVYGNQDFIINAFRFANKYAPESLELYYNDYNECDPKKCQGIVQLLTDVVNAEGTRITGMGMQGHYQNADNSPTIDQFMDAARAYAAVVDKVQLTELDFQANAAYDGTEATYAEEDLRLAYRYKDFYDAVKLLRAEGINFSGITIWGVIDKNSWLQTASFVGGGSDGKRHQMPLLYDDNYQVKSAFWAFVDPSKLHYAIKNMDLIEAISFDDDETCFASGSEYSFEKGNVKASFVPVWGKDGIKVKVTVSDGNKEDSDEVKVYFEGTDGIQEYAVLRSDAKEVSGGYEAIVTIPCEANTLKVASTIRLDVVVTNGNQTEAFNDHALNQAASSEYYAQGILKPYMIIPKGSVSVDGEMDDVWKTSPVTVLTINEGTNVAANARFLWDDEYLYAYVVVKDSALNADGTDAKDSVSICIDEKNQKSSAYQDDDKMYTIDYLNGVAIVGKNASTDTVTSQVKVTDQGYVLEAAFAWTHLKPFKNKEVGIEIKVTDIDAQGAYVGTLSFSDTTNTADFDTSVFGTATLVNESEVLYDDVTFADDDKMTDDSAKKESKPGFFARIWKAITGFFKALWKKIKSIFS